MDLRMQSYVFGYSAAISTVSPSLTTLQLLRVTNKVLPPLEVVKLGARIMPHQTFLKMLQMNCATPVKEWVNPWVAFASIGILQGGAMPRPIVRVRRSTDRGRESAASVDDPALGR